MTDCPEAYIEALYAAGSVRPRAARVEGAGEKEHCPVVGTDVARLLRVLAAATGARRVLEIGTGIGHSTIALAEVVRKRAGGRVTTVEYDERVAAQARRNFERAEVVDCVELLVGDAREIVPNLRGAFDLVFQDVDKSLYPVLFRDCVRLLRRGGLLVAEDTLFPVLDLDPKWTHLIEPIQEFNRLVVSCDELESTIVPVGDGVTIAVKL